MTSFHCCGVILCSVPSRVMPALLTSTSTGPELGRDLLHRRLARREVADVEL